MWTQQQIEDLKELRGGRYTLAEMADVVNKNLDETREMLQSIAQQEREGREREEADAKAKRKYVKQRNWTEEEIARFIKEFPYHSNKQICEMFDRELTSVQSKAYELRLRKDFSKYVARPVKRKEWTEEDKQMLRELYDVVPSEELAEKMDRTVESIWTMAWKLKIAGNRRPQASRRNKKAVESI